MLSFVTPVIEFLRGLGPKDLLWLAVAVLGFLLLKTCNSNQKLRAENEINEQNRIALTDSVTTELENKDRTYNAYRSLMVATTKDLKDQNKDLYDRVKSLTRENGVDGRPITFSDIGVGLNSGSQIIPAEVYYVQPDGTMRVGFSVDTLYDDFNGRILEGYVELKAKQPVVPGLSFKVQVGAFKRKVPDLTGMPDIMVEDLGNTKRYTVGDLALFDDANKIKDELRSRGYKDAFVVAYKDNERIAMNDAVDMQSEAMALAMTEEPEFVITRDKINVALKTGITKDDGLYKIYVTSDYPGFNVAKLDGAVLDPELLSKSDESAFVIGPQIGFGYGFGGEARPTPFMGIGVTYNLNKEVKELFK